MDKKTIGFFAGLILLLTSLACALPISITIGTQPTPAGETTQVQDDELVEPPIDSPTQIPAPEEVGIPDPIAVMTDPGDKKGVSLYGVDGIFLAELIFGQDLWLNHETTVIGSDLAPEPIDTVVLFYDFASSSLKKYHGPGNISDLAQIPNLLKILSKPYESIYVYSTINMQGNGAQTDLYWTDPYSFNAPIQEVSEFESRGFGIFPIGVRTGQGNVDIWYTHIPYGIGGDIVFPPYSGLHHFKTGGDYDDVILNDDARFSGLSESKKWVAYSTPSTQETTLYIQNLENSESHLLNLRPDSNRGAGYVVFSPDDRYLAWMEGSGWMMADEPDFYSTVRVATIDGNLVVEKLASELGTIAGMETNWAKPVAWLDDQTLLVQIHGLEWTDTAILKWNIPQNAIQYFIPGTFMDFVYPPQ